MVGFVMKIIKFKSNKIKYGLIQFKNGKLDYAPLIIMCNSEYNIINKCGTI